MKNILKAIIVLQLLTGVIFAIHGKIVFYDGTYVVGKVTKVDEATVYIVPIGLDTPEGVLVGNIDSLKMENGMVPVVSSAVKYFYQNGEFMANDDDWMDEYDNFQYDDFTLLQEEYKYEGSKKTHQQYYQVSGFGAIPILTAVSLQEDDGSFKMTPNIGLSFQMPYYPVGALDISPGFSIMTYSFEASHQGSVQALQIASILNFDFKPILYFFPENIHVSAEGGFTFNVAYDLNQDINMYPNVESENLTGGESYSGMGLNFGGSINYWMPKLPIAFKLFLNGNIVPQAPPFMDRSTLFGNIGLSLVLVLKRYQNNTEF